MVHKLHPGHAKECVTTTARITGANGTVGLLSRRDASSVVMVENASDKALKPFFRLYVFSSGLQKANACVK